MIFRLPTSMEAQREHRDLSLSAYSSPTIPLMVAGPVGRRFLSVTLDTGSGCVILSDRWLGDLGITQFVTAGRLHGVGSDRKNPPQIRYAQVTLRLGQGREVCQWSAVVGFTNAAMPTEGLFGIAGGLEYFHTALDVFANQLTMIPRMTLPVSADSV